MSHEPKKRHSRQRKGKRRAGILLSVPQSVQCLNCKASMLPHRVCGNCGFYNGKQIVKVAKTTVRRIDNQV
ncbi:MAG: 50S ribosomal protein L32 [Candidatus Levybacteria bacterium]|nr:50S ribosomal protein L32 [Candidatus Levybacteria bacterium]